MLKRDTRRHAAKAMLKQSGCYSNTLMYCMYAEEFTLRAVEKSSASFRIGNNTIACPDAV
ncbi:hypothetical protein EAO06_15885 [Klebsiella pneumoniae]|nr:hypothetical protein EAO06_15885 [Klebsiella pneumoniae]